MSDPGLRRPWGEEVVGGPWFDGEIRVDTGIKVHRLTSRDGMGLGIARCGLRQESRSNGWYYLNANNEYQTKNVASGKWPICQECHIEE